jgi:hypothetical protein
MGIKLPLFDKVLLSIHESIGGLFSLVKGYSASGGPPNVTPPPVGAIQKRRYNMLTYWIVLRILYPLINSPLPADPDNIRLAVREIIPDLTPYPEREVFMPWSCYQSNRSFEGSNAGTGMLTMRSLPVALWRQPGLR